MKEPPGRAGGSEAQFVVAVRAYCAFVLVVMTLAGLALVPTPQYIILIVESLYNRAN